MMDASSGRYQPQVEGISPWPVDIVTRYERKLIRLKNQRENLGTVTVKVTVAVVNNTYSSSSNKREQFEFELTEV